MTTDNTVLIYQDENEITKIQHIDSIYRDNELDKGATNKKWR